MEQGEVLLLSPSEAAPFQETPRVGEKLQGMERWLPGFHTGAVSSELPLHRHRNEGHSPAFL